MQAAQPPPSTGPLHHHRGISPGTSKPEPDSDDDGGGGGGNRQNLSEDDVDNEDDHDDGLSASRNGKRKRPISVS